MQIHLKILITIAFFTVLLLLITSCSNTSDIDRNIPTEKKGKSEEEYEKYESMDEPEKDSKNFKKENGGIANVLVDEKSLRGTHTISECLQKSKEVPLVFYLLDSSPKKDAIVDAVIMFYRGKVVLFDSSAIKSLYNDCTIGDILKINQTELINNLTAEHEKLVNEAVSTFFEQSSLQISASVGLYKKGVSERSNGTETLYFCKDKPVESNYYVVIYTDDSGNKVDNEYVMLPEIWQSDSIMKSWGSYIAGLKCIDYVTGYYNDGYDVLAGNYESDVEYDIEEWKSLKDELNRKVYNSGMNIKVLDAIKIDISQSFNGKIYDNDYVGFEVLGGGSIIALCDGEAKITIDDMTEVRKNKNIIIDPKQEDDIIYRIDKSIYDSIESLLDKKSVEDYLDKRLNKDLAAELLEDEEYEWAYKLLDYLGLQEDINQNKYDRALRYIEEGYDYDLAYKLLGESGHEDEIADNKYNRAQVLLMYGSDYDLAYSLLEESGHEDEIILNKYQRAMDYINYGYNYDLAYQLLWETGNDDIVTQNKYDRAVQYLAVEDYDNAYRLFSEIGYYNEIKESKYNRAVNLLNRDKIEEARELFMSLKGYKDTDELIIKSLPKGTCYENNTPVYDSPSYDGKIIGYLDYYEKVYIRGWYRNGYSMWNWTYWWEDGVMYEGWASDSVVDVDGIVILLPDMIEGY